MVAVVGTDDLNLIYSEFVAVARNRCCKCYWEDAYLCQYWLRVPFWLVDLQLRARKLQLVNLKAMFLDISQIMRLDRRISRTSEALYTATIVQRTLELIEVCSNLLYTRKILHEHKKIPNSISEDVV